MTFPRRQVLRILVVSVIGMLSLASVLSDTRTAMAQAEVTQLSELVRIAGDDPRAETGRIRIPSLGIDAPVGARAVPGVVGSEMPNPYGPGDVAWYEFGHPSFGGEPGSGRNVVMSGHIDYNAAVPHARVRYRGPGIFADLGELQPGDVIEVVHDGQVHRYAASWKRTLAEASTAWEGILSSEMPIESLTLYTCDRVFDRGRVSYSHRLVVRAELLEGPPNQFRDAEALQGYSVFRSGTTHPAVLFQAQRRPITILFMWHEG